MGDGSLVVERGARRRWKCPAAVHSGKGKVGDVVNAVVVVLIMIMMRDEW
jgi:hypothetical protein